MAASSSSLKLGVIGTGAIGQDHIRRCSQTLLHASVVAVTDLDLAHAAKVMAALGLKARLYADGLELVQAHEVEAVLVTSWGPSHEGFVLAAIAAGKPVFCEKPLAVTAEGCKRIVEAELAAGRRLVQVGFMRPYDEGYRALKAVIDAGAIGQPLMLHCAHRNPWVGPRYHTEMAITDTLIHELDVLRWLLDDDYKSVQVVFPRTSSNALAPLRDPQVVLIETLKGTRIDVEVFVNCQYGYDIQCEVVGESGIARLPEPPQIQLRKQAMCSSAILMDWQERFIAAYDVELQAFIDGVLIEQVGGPSAWDGFAAAIAGDACIEAQKSGAIVPVCVPDRPRFYG